MRAALIKLIFLSIGLLAGCSSGSGGHDDGQPDDSTPVIDGGQVRVNSKCLKRSCGDNFLLHLSTSDLQKVRLSLTSFRTPQEGAVQRRVSSAVVLGGELAKFVNKFDLKDEKTSDCVVWLLSKVVDESGYAVGDRDWESLSVQLGELNKN